MCYEPEFYREREICRVLGERGAKDARGGLPEDPDPLSEGELVDLTSFYLSDTEFLAGLFVRSYRQGYASVPAPRGP